MRSQSLLLLRVSLGLFLVIWGVDKLANVKHGIEVSDSFFFGAFSHRLLLRGYGVAEIAVGALIVLGVARRLTYPVLLAITGITLLGVWKSVLDPWGWWLEGTTVLFYPSLIIVAASLVLWTFHDDDRQALSERFSLPAPDAFSNVGIALRSIGSFSAPRTRKWSEADAVNVGSFPLYYVDSQPKLPTLAYQNASHFNV